MMIVPARERQGGVEGTGEGGGRHSGAGLPSNVNTSPGGEGGGENGLRYTSFLAAIH